jgi:hypothetical protein
MMKKILFSCLLLATCSAIFTRAQQINGPEADKAAQHWITQHGGFSIQSSDLLTGDRGETLGYEYCMSPTGYLVLSADQSLPPVIAYSLSSASSVAGEPFNPLRDMLILDLGIRVEQLELVAEDERERNRSRWVALLEEMPVNKLFEQWPPPGSTSTGGWLETNWHQSDPYNMFCPMDNVNSARSVAGCPAVALAMIIHYQRNLNGTRFSDLDDYYHSYAGRQYWIDDDSQGWDFPAFPVLNQYFDSIEMKFPKHDPLSNEEKAALVFGCGVAAGQVYTSQVSGTFGVDQAYDAYLRFGYGDAMLIYDSDTSFYTQMKDDIREGRPVHLAVLSNTGQGGHNVVADGYNTNEYYHLNFGWGGSYNGWYLLPDEIPYNLTIIEGAVVDIGSAFVAVSEPTTEKSPGTRIFPNPVKDYLYIDCPDIETNKATVTIYGPLGNTVIEEKINPWNALVKIDMCDLSQGMYLCRIKSGNNSSTFKIIKE